MKATTKQTLSYYWRFGRQYKGMLFLTLFTNALGTILGFILITPHAFLHAFGFFTTIDLFGIATYVVMIPLTLVSFKIINVE